MAQTLCEERENSVNLRKQYVVMEVLGMPQRCLFHLKAYGKLRPSPPGSPNPYRRKNRLTRVALEVGTQYQISRPSCSAASRGLKKSMWMKPGGTGLPGRLCPGVSARPERPPRGLRLRRDGAADVRPVAKPWLSPAVS